jgi:hypothetical protein
MSPVEQGWTFRGSKIPLFSTRADLRQLGAWL